MNVSGVPKMNQIKPTLFSKLVHIILNYRFTFNDINGVFKLAFIEIYFRMTN